MKKEEIKNNLFKTLPAKFVIYNASFRLSKDIACFILKDNSKKYLGVIGPERLIREAGFKKEAEEKIRTTGINGYIVKLFKRDNDNAWVLLNIFPQLKPTPLGLNTSFGFGDRLGVANAAHLKLIKKQKGIMPVLAQQSVRELLKTGKDFNTVLAQSVWNIIQEGYEGRWGADADHIKDKEYFVKAADAGMTMYTLDTSDYLDEKILNLTDAQIKQHYNTEGEHTRKLCRKYSGKRIKINGNLLDFSEGTVIRLALLYGNALKFTKEIFEYLSSKLKIFDYEVSFDETNTITTPEAHYFIANEMKDLKINFTSLALRFPGVFEKGIDYIGDIEEFDKSINMHGIICRQIGGYKLSLHSGSDKLSIYPSFNKHTDGFFHIKTSGTSWLEAVRLVAYVQPEFFKKLYDMAYDTFEENKKAYHVNLDKSSIPHSLHREKEGKLPSMLDDSDIRRVFHIAYGEILGREKQQFMDLLFKNEQQYYDCLTKNFKKHFDALKH